MARNYRKTLYLSNEEKVRLSAKAKEMGMTLGSYIRYVAIHAQIEAKIK